MVCSSVQVRLGAHALLVDDAALREAIETVGGRIWGGLAGGDEMGEAPAGGGRCLEAAIAPAGIEIEAFDRRRIDDGRAVHGHVEQAAPGAQDAQAPDDRHQRHAALGDVLDHRHVAALGVGVVALDVAAKDEPAFVGLAAIEVAGAEGDDDVEQRLDTLGDEGLHRVALDGQAQARHLGDARGIAGNRQRHFLGADESLLGLDARDATVLDAKAGGRAILDDVDAAGIGGARIAPGDRVVAHRAADSRGVDIIQNCAATGFRIENGRVTGVETEKGFIGAKKVALSVAGNSTRVAEMAGLRLPIESHAVQAFVTEGVKPLLDIVITFGAGHFYCSQSDKGGLVFGGDIEGYNSYAQRGNMPVIEDVAEGGMALMPVIGRLRILRSWGGLLDMTMDGSPIIDVTPVEGLYLNAGWCYGGFKATPAAGWCFAHLIATGEPHPYAAAYRLDRFAEGRVIDEKGMGAQPNLH